MFTVYCHVHESQVLLDTSRIEALRPTHEGPVLDWQCWCGARGSLVAGVRSRPRTGEPAEIGPGRDDDLGRDLDRSTVGSGHPGAAPRSGPEGPTDVASDACVELAG